MRNNDERFDINAPELGVETEPAIECDLRSIELLPKAMDSFNRGWGKPVAKNGEHGDCGNRSGVVTKPLRMKEASLYSVD